MNKLLKLEISAETKEQADDILNALLAKKIVTGGQIIEAPARFLWKDKIANMNYWAINSFTVEVHKQNIVDTVKDISIEEVPMISFTAIEANSELAVWIKETVRV